MGSLRRSVSTVYRACESWRGTDNRVRVVAVPENPDRCHRNQLPLYAAEIQGSKQLSYAGGAEVAGAIREAVAMLNGCLAAGLDANNSLSHEASFWRGVGPFASVCRTVAGRA